MDQVTQTLTTEQVIISQLTENCGTHFLDSGGIFGRNWQRNQGRDFAKEPSSRAEWDAWRKEGAEYGKLELCATISLYHWMVHNLEFDPEQQAKLDELAEEMPNESWLGLADEFANRYGGKDSNCYNTYNTPDTVDLSQVLQYHTLFLDEDNEYDPSHVVICVHGGADVRGGYSSPRVYKLKHDESYHMLDTARVDYIDAGHNCWYMDYGSSLDAGSHNDPLAPKDLFDLPCFKRSWVTSDAIAELESRLARANQDQQALLETTLDGDRRKVAVDLMRDTVNAMLKEAEDLVIDTLYEQYEQFIIVDDGRAWLFIGENTCGDGFEMRGLEMTAGNSQL